MTESLESFVKKLQSEGVEAGKGAAEKIKKEAKHGAEKILADAKAEAEKIVAKAESDAERQLSRAQSELELAVRDAILKLGESLGCVLSVMLARRVEKKLSEPDYIGEIMREVIIAYVTAQRSGLSQADLFAVQRLPSNKASQFKSQLSSYGIRAAVSTRPAEEEEAPPTLIRYSSWARPTRGLFDILSTLPGYREMDLSPFFMLALSEGETRDWCS